MDRKKKRVSKERTKKEMKETEENDKWKIECREKQLRRKKERLREAEERKI